MKIVETMLIIKILIWIFNKRYIILIKQEAYLIINMINCITHYNTKIKLINHKKIFIKCKIVNMKVLITKKPKIKIHHYIE